VTGPGSAATPRAADEAPSFLPRVRAEDMSAEINEAREYGSERPCEVGRIGYRIGLRDYIVLAFRYTDGSNGEQLPWFLTWVGEVGYSPGRLPVGVEPSLEMLAALELARPRRDA
jgi:hypothetical protein